MEQEVTVAEVWDELLKLGFTKVRSDRAVKDRFAIEVGYGSWTIRTRLYDSNRFVGRWDLATKGYAAGSLEQMISEVDSALSAHKQTKKKG